VRNAEKALATLEDARLDIHAACSDGRVQVTLSDNGPGVSDPARLFRPFGGGPSASGLGLYLSRAMMLSFHGDLLHKPGGPGATFILEMIPAEVDL
jgi:C4-dicarboxylate-specific signal transduction histidine kinase